MRLSRDLEVEKKIAYNTPYDELLLECPPEEVEKAGTLLKDAMEHVIELRVPLLAEVHQGTNWAEAK